MAVVWSLKSKRGCPVPCSGHALIINMD
jgi:hypothetical protein